MKVIVIANQKGGVGKTTSCYNLAAAKAQQLGKKGNVLMIDWDAQSSLTCACGFNPSELGVKNSCNLLNKKSEPLLNCIEVNKSGLENLYLIPAIDSLASVKISNLENQLRRALEKMSEDFAYIFIDCAPELGEKLLAALYAADKVIIPIKTELLSYNGLSALRRTINDLGRADLDISVIATMFKKTNDNRDILEILQEKENVLGVIKDAAAVNKNIIDGQPIVVAHKNHEVAKEYYRIAKSI